MKKLMLLIICVVFGSQGFAKSFDQMSKEEQANYEITVTDKRTGEVIGKMTRDQYKVIKIEEPKTFEIPPEVLEAAHRLRQMFNERLGQVVKRNKEVVSKYRSGYNSVILHAGTGKDGLDRGHSGQAWEVEEKDSLVAGATYCRSKESTGLCGSAFTNKTFLLGVKLDF